MFFVYILQCSDNSYYVGHTDSIEKRVGEHKGGLSSYAKNKLPIKVVFIQEFQERCSALELERKIKRWTRCKKEALIQGNWQLLSQLSKKSFIKG